VVELGDSCLLGRQVLYHLSHAPTPFHFSYLWNRVLYFCPGQAWTDSLLLSPLCSWDNRLVTPCTVLLIEMDLTEFLSALALKLNPPYLSFWSSWDYRYEPLCPPVSFLLRQDLTFPSLVWNLRSSSFSLSSAVITDVYHHRWLLYLFLEVVEIELRTLSMLGKHSTLDPLSSPLAFIVYFSDRVSCFCLGQPQTISTY
jgi:hypothetical protein